MTDDKNTNNESNPTERSDSFSEHPTHIGAYRILDVLGEGGMAVVYLAEQSEPVKRRVALKIVKLGMDSKQVVARFESERQALAVLDHPNIAKVFDGGITDTGRPYFVMELVHGIPITDYCDDHRLSTNDRVRLFAAACSAVQHAHHKGLIHRDLKPSNLLVGVVDGKPQVKIIDFGIAKATGTSFTDKTLFTKIGQLIGTPQYMSPEQADITGLDVDTRTDIYSLGVVLYELLVGVVPIDLTAVGEQAIRVAVRERDAPRPSTRITELGDTKDEIARARSTDVEKLRRQIKGDLDWVVMRAIAKDRTRRYETANALAMECRRFLNHEPVLARPPSAGYLMQRFVRRNRAMVVAGSVALVAILAGAVAATVGFVQATQAEATAVQEAETSRATTQFLVDLFQVSDPWSFTPVRSESGADITAREVLDMGAKRIRNDLQNEPVIQSGLMIAIGRVYMGLGLPDRARPLILDSLELRRQAHPSRHIAIGDSLLALGTLHLINGDYEQAVAAQREGISIYQEAWGDDAFDLAWMLSRFAVTLSNNGDIREAMEVQLHSLEILRAETEPNHFLLGQALNNLGFVQNLLSLKKEALVSFEDAVAALSQTKARGLYSRALANLAATYMLTGRLAESKELQEEALAIKREWFGLDHIEIGYSVANLSHVYQQFGDFEKAGALNRESIEIFSRRLGENHPNIGIVLGSLAANLTAQKKYAEAEATFFDSLDRIQTSFGPDSMRELPVQNGIGNLYNEQDRFEEAEARFREALRIGTGTNAEHSDVAIARAGIAKLSVSSLNDEEREQYFSVALEQLRNNEGLGTTRAALIQLDFAAFLAGQRETSRARELFEDGLNHLVGALPAENPLYQEQVNRYEALFGVLPAGTNDDKP